MTIKEYPILCQNCNGKGNVMYQNHTTTAISYIQCPACKGFGYVQCKETTFGGFESIETTNYKPMIFEGKK